MSQHWAIVQNIYSASLVKISADYSQKNIMVSCSPMGIHFIFLNFEIKHIYMQ